MEEHQSLRKADIENLDDAKIILENCSYSWGFRVKEDQKDSKRAKVMIEYDSRVIVKGLNFDLKKGELMVIVGQVGCGKTTLLHSIMEETRLCEGKHTIEGTIAYVEQEPFIISGSIEENILMGLEFNSDKFEQALQASQLIRDVDGFKKREKTVIGERGINVSGGQRARISLARAVYSDADIYLLDDPLSAVDPQVAHDIFENCISGVLKDKIVILVTH